MSKTQIDGGVQIQAGTVTLGVGGDVTGTLTTGNGGTGLATSGSTGNLLTSNGSVWVSTPSSASADTPQVPTAGFTVASNTQILFGVDIDLQSANGDLTVSGILQGVH